MGRYFARLVKAMFISAIGFGGGIGLLIMIFIIINDNGPDKFYVAMRSGAGLGLVFGLLYVFLLLLLDLTARMYFARGHYNEVWEMEQTRELTMVGSSKHVLAVSREALLLIPYVRAVTEDAENLVARATTGTSWRSAGEVVEVEINPLSENEWSVKCTSKPGSSSIVFDYGKNFVNVETWFSKVTKLNSDKKALGKDKRA